MKILWTNPAFLDYRVPFYEELNRLSNGSFHLVYSRSRIPQRCEDKIKNALGDNAHALAHEKSFQFGNKRDDFSCKSISLPYPSGLSRLLSTIEADIVISEGFFQWTPWALRYAHKYKLPLMLAYERTAHTERNCPAWRTFYRKCINRGVDGYLLNGSLCREYVESVLKVGDKILVEGVMAADSAGCASRCKGTEQACSNKDSGIIYIFVGRLIALKGVKYLLAAWHEHVKKYPSDRLLIVGDGPERDALQTMSDSTVEFAGSIDYDKISDYYARADVFVMPTLEDNWSLVVPEAMACGLPIACSCFNGCYPELVMEGENGTVFNPLEQETLIKALAGFHEWDLASMGNRSRLLEKEYTPEKCARRAYEGMLAVLAKHTK